MTAPHGNKLSWAVKLMARQNAIAMLNELAGRMNHDLAKRFCGLDTIDWGQGSAKGLNTNEDNILSNLETFNFWVKQFWTAAVADLPALLQEFFAIRPLKGAGGSFPSLMAHLRAPEQYNVWCKAAHTGVQTFGYRLPNYDVTSQNGYQRYSEYNAAALRVRDTYRLHPREADLHLVWAKVMGCPPPLTEHSQVVSDKNTEQGECGSGGLFDPSDLTDSRILTVQMRVLRQGQGAFKTDLLKAYDHRCAVTDCNVEAVLQACHIIRYLGPDTNSVQNGLLLRADIHLLYDRRLLAVDAPSMTVLISPRLFGTEYAFLAGRSLRLPEDRQFHPSVEALKLQRTETGL